MAQKWDDLSFQEDLSSKASFGSLEDGEFGLPDDTNTACIDDKEKVQQQQQQQRQRVLYTESVLRYDVMAPPIIHFTPHQSNKTKKCLRRVVSIFVAFTLSLSGLFHFSKVVWNLSHEATLDIETKMKAIMDDQQQDEEHQQPQDPWEEQIQKNSTLSTIRQSDLAINGSSLSSNSSPNPPSP